MADVAQVVLVELDDFTAGEDESESDDLGAHRTAAKFFLRATAVSGTLTVAIETSADNSTGWRQVGRFSPRNVPGVDEIALDGLDQYVRAAYSVGSSATFSVTGEAHQLYATAEDLKDVLDRDIIDRVRNKDSSRVPRFLIKATALMEGALDHHHPLPLSSVPELVRHHTAYLAAKNLERHSGEVGGGVDEALDDGYEEAVAFMEDAKKRRMLAGETGPATTPATRVETPARAAASLLSTSNSSRWGDDDSV